MSDDMELRPMDINDKVAIEVPAYVAWGFLCAYNSTRWANAEANVIATAITKAMVHPRVLSEMLASQQDKQEMQKQIEDKMRRLAAAPDLLSGLPGFPGFPGMPDTETPET